MKIDKTRIESIISRLVNKFNEEQINSIMNGELTEFTQAEQLEIKDILFKNGIKDIREFKDYCTSNKDMMNNTEEAPEEETPAEEISTEEVPEEEAPAEEVSAEEPLDEAKLSPKGKKVLAKIEKLCEKVNQEKNPFKLQLLKFKIRMLQVKIQRELDLINIKETYNIKRDELKKDFQATDSKNINDLAKIADQIYLKKQVIKSNSECDPKSPDFIYDEGTIQRQGGLGNLAKTLQSSEDSSVRNTGKRIEEIARVRQELAELQKQYNEKKNSQKNIESKYDASTKELNSDEKRLTVAKKYNIFTKIGDFFKNIRAGIKDIRTNMQATKAIDDKYEEEAKKAREEYQKIMSEIDKKRKEAIEEERNSEKKRFSKEIRLTGKQLEEANAPVQTEETTHENEEPVQENSEPVEATPTTDEDAQTL